MENQRPRTFECSKVNFDQTQPRWYMRWFTARLKQITLWTSSHGHLNDQQNSCTKAREFGFSSWHYLFCCDTDGIVSKSPENWQSTWEIAFLGEHRKLVKLIVGLRSPGWKGLNPNEVWEWPRGWTSEGIISERKDSPLEIRSKGSAPRKSHRRGKKKKEGNAFVFSAPHFFFRSNWDNEFIYWRRPYFWPKSAGSTRIKNFERKSENWIELLN